MPLIDTIDEKKYGRLLAKYLPGVIRSDDEHDRLAGLLMKLALAEERPAEEERLIELLERLVDDYDERRMKGRLQSLNPLAALEQLIRQIPPKPLKPVWMNPEHRLPIG